MVVCGAWTINDRFVSESKTAIFAVGSFFVLTMPNRLSRILKFQSFSAKEEDIVIIHNLVIQA